MAAGTLGYAGPQVEPPPPAGWWRAAMLLAAAPLVAGVLILVLYLLTDWDGWVTAGLYTLIAGPVSMLVSAVLIAVYWWSGWGCDPLVRARVNRYVIAVLAVIALNFPAAYACVAIGGSRAMSYRIAVTNAGAGAVPSFVLSAPGVRMELGPIPPGETVRRRLEFASDGQLIYALTHEDGTKASGAVEGYVTPGWAGARRITVQGTAVTIHP